MLDDRLETAPARSRTLTLSPRAWRIVTIALGACALIVLGAVIERALYRGEALAGVRVAGRDVGGDSERRLAAELQRVADRMQTRAITAHVGAATLTVTASELHVRVDVAATARAVRRDGRSANPLDALAGFVLRRFRPDHVAMHVTWDQHALDGVLAQWRTETLHGVREGGIAITGTAVTVVTPTSGTGIDVAAARGLVKAALHDPHDPHDLVLPITRADPAVDAAAAARAAARARAVLTGEYTIHSSGRAIVASASDVASALTTRVDGHELALVVDPDRLRRALASQLHGIGTAPQPATFRVDDATQTVSMVSSRDGTGPDLTAAGRAIVAGTRDIDVPLGRVHPDHDDAWARSLGIHELVATFTTRHPCCAARVTNIHVGARYIDGTVLEPGQLFSLNGIVGPRTPARGFVVAPVYYEEGFTQDVGGGVSQLATTTFNAAWWGGFQIVEHQPHTIYFDRYPMGREATVNYPYLDLRWRNDSHHGVLVHTTFTDTSVTVALYGDREGKTVREVWGRCRVGPVVDTHDDPRCMHVISTTPSTTEVLTCPVKKPSDDPTALCPTLKPGEQKESEPGHTGYVVEFDREITRPGQAPVVEHYQWRYQMLPDVILVGAPPPGATTTTTGVGVTTTTVGH